MKKPLLVANWKNHPDSLERARTLLGGLKRKSSIFKKLDVFVAPPLSYIESVAASVRSIGNLAVQDISSITEGTHTGEVGAEILKSFGVKLAIIGHSERRTLGETSEMIRSKIKIALRAGITPLLCVGEHERDADGEHFEYIRLELRAALEGLKKKEDAKRLMVAYEPIWAIGKRAADAIRPDDLAQMVIFIKKVLTDMFGRDTAEGIAILYGGSIEASNVQRMSEAGVSGFLVGHASLDAKEFAGIAEALIL